MIPRRRIFPILAAAWLIVTAYVVTQAVSVGLGRGSLDPPWVQIPAAEVPGFLTDRTFEGTEFVRLANQDAQVPEGWSRGPNDRFLNRSIVFGEDGSARMAAGDDQARFLGTWRFASEELCLSLTAVEPEDTGRQVDRCFDLYRNGPKVMLWSGTESRWLGRLR